MAYFEIGLFAPLHTENIGTLWRSAYQMGAAGIFVIGKRQRFQKSDTALTHRQLPFRTFATWDDFLIHRPIGARLVAIELGGINLSTFNHPSEAIYLLGSEANGLPPHVLAGCDDHISLEALRHESYNVAVEGSIVMYHRQFFTKTR